MNKIKNTQKYALSAQDLIRNSEELMKQVFQHLKEAENTSYEGRTFTYARGGPGGYLPFKEASDKAWIALSQVTDVLVDKLLGRTPKGHYDRRIALREIEMKWPEMAAKNFYDRYGSLSYYIRNNTQYYSMMDLEMLRFETGRLNNLIADIRKVVSK
ncbi:MAG: hypothetical protein FJ358_05340 [Thaumarchaeota archaeon]|nr:hypothetical protein [Nitrososphaerota archaeon]